MGWRDAPVLLTVGRLQARKGHDRVIEALPAILRHVPELRFVIVGNGPDRSRLESLAQSLDVAHAVEWHVVADDHQIRTFYQQCDLFILANRQIGSDVEGFGMVLLEAAACGKPTITGTSGGTREAIIDGVTGDLIDANDSQQIVQAVCRMFDNPRRCESLGRAGRQRVEQAFDWPILARQLERALGFS